MKLALFIGYKDDWHLNEVKSCLDDISEFKTIIFDPSNPVEIYFNTKNPNEVYIQNIPYEIGCIWWRWKAYVDDEFRRKGSTDTHNNLEWYHFLKAIWILNEDRAIHDYYNAIRYNEKLVQSQKARQAGLKIPDTACTNSRVHIEELLYQARRAVKPIRVASLMGENGQSTFLSTAELLKTHVEQIDDKSLNDSITLLQSFIDKSSEIRLNYLFGKIYARKFEKSKILKIFDKNIVDWRYVYELHNRVSGFSENYEPSSDMIAAVNQYCRNGNLKIVCFDFVIINEDVYFLEANPDGQWGWLGDEAASVSHVAESIKTMLELSSGNRPS